MEPEQGGTDCEARIDEEEDDRERCRNRGRAERQSAASCREGCCGLTVLLLLLLLVRALLAAAAVPLFLGR